MKKIASLFIFTLLFMLNAQNSVLLENNIISLEAEGTAIIGNGITIEDAKVFAVNDAKRNALEQVGTYLESNTTALNYVITKDEIKTFTGSVLKADVLKTENALLEGSFALKVKIKVTVDTGLLNKRIDEVRNDSELKRQLENERKRVEELTKQIAELQKSTNAKSESRKISDRLTASEFFAKGQKAAEADEMIKLFSKAIELDSEYAEAYLWRGYAYTQKKDYDSAMRDYAKAIEIQPLEGNNYRTRGYAYLDLKEDLKAAEDFAKAAGLGNSTAMMYAQATKIYYEKGMFDKAVELNTGAIKKSPNDAGHYVKRGYSYLGMKNYDKALSDFDQAVKLNPVYPDGYRGRAEAYSYLNRIKDTVDDINEYLRLSGGKNPDAEDLRKYIRDKGFEPKH